MRRLLTVVLLFTLAACSTQPTPSNGNGNSQPVASSQPAASSQPSSASAEAKPVDALKEGEASGSIVDEGTTIVLKHAYAGYGEMFGEEAVVILVSESPMTPEALANYFVEKFAQYPKDNKGLEYNVGKGFWVRYRPSGFQTSGINTLKTYSVENGIVKGRDEDSTNFDGKEYKRSVSFVARLPEKK